MRLIMDADFSAIDSFFRKATAFLSGQTTTVYAKLGRRVADDFREMVVSGGPRHAGVTGFHPGDEATSPPQGWQLTSTRWQYLRNKDSRPLYHTGKFADSFSYNTIPGEAAVEVGSTDKRSRRFHFGDAALGQRWSWSAWVDDSGRIISDALVNQPFEGELITPGEGYRLQRFAPIIQPRNWMVIYTDTVDEWFREDVGGQLGLYP